MRKTESVFAGLPLRLPRLCGSRIGESHDYEIQGLQAATACRSSAGIGFVPRAIETGHGAACLLTCLEEVLEAVRPVVFRREPVCRHLG
jgi:hypothetical protein